MAGNIHLTFSAQSNMSAVQAQMEAMRKSTSRLGGEIVRFNRTMATQGTADIDGWRRLGSEITGVRNDYVAMAQQSGAYTTATRTLTTATSDFNNQLARQKVRLRDVMGQGNMVRAAMREQMALNNMMVKGYTLDATGKMQADLYVPKTVDIQNFQAIGKQIGYYNNILRSVAQETVNWGKNTQWAGRQLTVGFTVPISIAAGLLGKMALEADTGLTRIVKVYGDAESNFQATTDSIRAMATDTASHIASEFGKAASETRDVMGELAATGLAGPELQGMTFQTQRLSMLGEMSSDEALKLTRVLREVYGFSSDELEKQVNYFNEIENSTALTMQDVTEGIPRIAGIMKATGTSITEQTELLVAFKSAGIDVAEGANALKSINFKAVAATPTAANAFFRITGQSMQDLVDKTEGQFVPMMMEIANVMKGLEQQDKVDLVARVFGIHQGSRTITLLEQLTEGSAGMMRAVEVGQKSAGERANAARKEIEALQESASLRFRAMIQGIRASMESIGETVLEIIIPVGESISKLFKWIQGLDESTKKWVVTLAAVLAATGPFIMLIGLFANLVGMAGRGLGAIVGMFFKFKILNAETKAGQLLQQSYNQTLGKGTQDRLNHTMAIEGMTKAMTHYNRRLEEQHAILARQAGSPSDYRALTGRTATHDQNVGPMTRQQDYWQNQSAISNQSRAQKERDLLRDKNYWENESAFAAQGQAAIKANASVLKFAQGMGTASMAAMVLGQVTENELITKIGGVAFAISALLPLFPLISQASNMVFARMGVQAGIAGTAIGTRIAAGVAVAKTALTGLMRFMIGPWGLAIGGAIAAVAYFWKKHRDEIKETKRMYDSLTDSAEALGKIYDFMPTTPLERELEANPNFNQDTRWGQRQRVEEIKGGEETEQFYKDLVEWSRRAREENDALAESILKSVDSTSTVAEMNEARSKMAIVNLQGQQRILDEAIAQGANVLANTGDSEKAKRAAWDMYNVMTGEFMSFEAFQVKLQIEEGSKNTMLDSIDDAAAYAGQAMGRNIAREMALAGNRSLNGLDTTEFASRLRQDVTRAIELAGQSADVDMVMESLGTELPSQVNTVVAAYHEAIAQGLWKAEDGLAGFVKKLHQIERFDPVTWEPTIESLNGLTDTQIKGLQEIMLTLDEHNSHLLEQLGLGKDLADLLSGRDAALREIAGNEMWILELKIQQLEAEGNLAGAEAARARLARVRGRAEEIRLERVETEKNTAAIALMNAANEEAINVSRQRAEAAAEMTDEEQKAYDTFRTSMEHYQNQQVDYYVDQFNADQDAQRKALDDEGKRLLDSIDARYKVQEDALAARHKGEQEALANRHELAKEALASQREQAQESLRADREAAQESLRKEREAAQQALRDAREAAQEAQAERQKAESKAQQERQKLETKALEKAHERRRNDIAEVWDVQIKRIEDQIAQEEKLEQVRQRIFENERKRISRLRELFSDNIDMNMAINTGDLDEAARISNEMSAKRGEWAQDDLSQLSADGSKTRKEILGNRIDDLKAQKDAELDNIKEVEEKEKESLQRRQENAKEHLQKVHDEQKKALQKEYQNREKNLQEQYRLKDKALADEYKLLEKALADDFKAREKQLADVQKLEKENLDARMEEQRKALQTARDNERAAQEAATAKNKEELDRQLKDAKKSFDDRAAYWRGMVGRNREEADRINEAMHEDFKENHLKPIKKSDFNTRQAMWRDTQRMHKENVNQMAQDEAWEDMAKEIAQAVIKGSLGFSMTPGQITKFIRTGELPEDKKGGMGSLGKPNAMLHSGGIAGNPGDYSASGPGFRGASQEVDATLLKGEGVLNLRAMNIPGVPDMLRGLNRGQLGGPVKPTPSMNKKAYGDGPGLPGMIAPLKVMMGNLAHVATERGVEVGMRKMDAIVEIVLSGKNAGILSGEQLRNAEAIISTGFKMGMSERDIIIGIMTAMQESSLRNINYGDDIHGVRNPDGTLTSSLGLFQQQKWWGSVEDRMDPYKSSELFFKALMGVRNREEMPLWMAADSVQRSAFPTAYGRHERLARMLLENAQFMSFGSMSDANFQGGRGGKGMAWQTIWGMIKKAAPEAVMTSNFRPGATTAGYGNQSYHALGRAVDIASGNMMKTFSKVRGLLPWSELIHTPAGRGQMVNGKPFWNFAPITKAQHYDHIHLAYKNGGSVPGRGKGDKVPAMLEPGEFVVRSSVADKSRAFLSAFNNGDFDFMPTAGLGRTNVNATGNIDTGGHNTYNVDMTFTGPIDSDVDVRRAVFSVLKEVERSKPRSRRVTH